MIVRLAHPLVEAHSVVGPGGLFFRVISGRSWNGLHPNVDGDESLLLGLV
jgi:hypothetical protein